MMRFANILNVSVSRKGYNKCLHKSRLLAGFVFVAIFVVYCK